MRANQFLREICSRPGCGVCVRQDGNQKVSLCDRSNVGYEGDCLRCNEVFKYVGETSRTAFTRVKEHISDYRAASAARLHPPANKSRTNI